MRLDSKAQNPEAVTPYGIALDSCLVLENVVYWLGEEADEGVSLRGGDEDAAQLEPQYLAHAIESRLKLG